MEGYHNPDQGIVALPDGMVPQHTLRQFYKAADVNVSASGFETFGMTVLEARLCGTPSIVQNAGAELLRLHCDSADLLGKYMSARRVYLVTPSLSG